MKSNPREGRSHPVQRTGEDYRANTDTLPVVSDSGAALAVQDTCTRVSDSLTRSIGAAGTRALFARALAQSRTDHPAIQEIQIGNASDSILSGVNEAVGAHGEVAVIVGLETLLGALLTLLGRLIGEDMVTRLMAQIAPRDVPSEQVRDD